MVPMDGWMDGEGVIFIQIYKEWRGCCLPIRGTRDGTAEGGVISKKVKRIFQRVGEIIDENQKKNRAQKAVIRNSSLDRKRG